MVFYLRLSRFLGKIKKHCVVLENSFCKAVEVDLKFTSDSEADILCGIPVEWELSLLLIPGTGIRLDKIVTVEETN